MDGYTLVGAGLLAVVLALAALGAKLIALAGQCERLRADVKALEYRWVIIWQVATRRRLGPGEMAEAAQMNAEARELEER